MKNRYLDYIKEIRDVCRKKKFRLKKIGATNAPYNFGIYAVVINSEAKHKRTVLFQAGIHGDEESGPNAIREFLKEYEPKTGHPKIIVLPVVNPYGFYKIRRRNSRKMNLNRRFMHTKMCRESKQIMNFLKNEDLYFASTFHEDDFKSGSYIYAYFDENHIPKIYTKLIGTANKFVEICLNKKIYRQKAKNGIVIKPRVDGSFEERMYDDGVPYVICTEVSDKRSMAERIKINKAIMKEIVAFSSRRK
jgi:hypothetical protein